MVSGDHSFLDAYDAATDISISAYFPALDERYPDSRFVLTTRAMEPWLESVERHFAARDIRRYLGESPAGIIRERVYGRRDFDRAAFIDAYHAPRAGPVLLPRPPGRSGRDGHLRRRRVGDALPVPGPGGAGRALPAPAQAGGNPRGGVIVPTA